jgi:transposase
VKEHVPDAIRHSATLIPAVSLEGPLAPFMFEGSLNGAIFAAYAEKFLLPSQPRGSVLAMDSLSARKAARACAALLKQQSIYCILPIFARLELDRNDVGKT